MHELYVYIYEIQIKFLLLSRISNDFGDQPARPVPNGAPPRDPCPDRREPRSAPHATQATRRLSPCPPAPSARRVGSHVRPGEVLHREPQSVLATHLLFSALGCLWFPATCAVVVVIVDLIALVDWRRCRRVLREGARSGRPTQAQAVDPSRT